MAPKRRVRPARCGKLLFPPLFVVLGYFVLRSHYAQLPGSPNSCPPRSIARNTKTELRLPIQWPALPDPCAVRRCASCLSPPGSFAPAASEGNTTADNPEGFHGMGGVREDQFLWEHFFYGQANGTFLEMGAVDGEHLSNSLWFARHASWRGLLIEALPDFFKSLVKKRRESTCVNAAVCSDFRTVTYLSHTKGPGVSGILEFMAPGFLERWYPLTEGVAGDDTAAAAAAEQQGQAGGGDAGAVLRPPRQNVRATWQLPCVPLSHILEQAGMSWFDFLSLDVEGAELEVLKTVDFRAVRFSVILVELKGDDPVKDQGVVDLLLAPAQGYRLYARDDRNAFFVHPSFKPSSKPGVRQPSSSTATARL